ncbi:MAG TPA: family 10 glycosylhydrolase [Gemmatimonadaceae bacterium]|nr:family 10 glycosylhydrolase [Gemmatimonadaceae bacterium]
MPITIRSLPLIALLAARAALAQTPAPAPTDSDAPPVAREFRGVWVASVANIDWPSRPGLSTWQQQVELLEILNRAVELHLNAVVLQVRPAADALYHSRYEPWSEYLTGEMGAPPEPSWDPLAFAVKEAHARGLELHAWINPFRAHHPTDTSAYSTNHVSRAHPEMVRQYGQYLWLDPGDAAVRRHSLRVVLDIVKRYDVDGIHIDDYFYPYKERDSLGQPMDFPDDSSWTRYVRAGGKMTRDDWRRHNIDLFIESMYHEVKKAKPWVKVGISPFGIWRPENPPGICCFDAYAELYADSRKWLAEGWLDYLTPQLYWSIGSPHQSYPVLLKWWAEHNPKGRHLWPGNDLNRIGPLGTSGWRADELLEQIRLTRAQPGATGNVYFSMKSLMTNRGGITDQLAGGPYAQPALVPASPWLSKRVPPTPKAVARVDTVTGNVVLHLAPGGKHHVWLWAVQARTAGVWTTAILPGEQRTHTIARGAGSVVPDEVVVYEVNRYGNQSAGRIVRPAAHPVVTVER